MTTPLVSAILHTTFGCEVFDTPERLPVTNIRSAFGGLRVWAGLSVFVLPLCGCAVGVGAEVVSYATSGKSIGDHVLDVVTGKDCNLVLAALRSDRNICEPGETKELRETEVTTGDFKGLSEPGNSPEGRSADPSLAAGHHVNSAYNENTLGSQYFEHLDHTINARAAAANREFLVAERYYRLMARINVYGLYCDFDHSRGYSMLAGNFQLRMKNFEDLAQQKFGGDREAYNKFEEYRNQESLRFVRENKVEICDSNRIAFINILNVRVNDLEVYFVSRPFGTE